MTKDDLVSKDTALKMASKLKAMGGYFDEAVLKQISLQEVAECIEALAQPAQEPVAWNEEEFNAIAYAYRTCPAHEIKMVSDRYQELVNYVLSITHPAPAWQGNKEFVGLSDDEREILYDKAIEMPLANLWNDYAYLIEQALKEKNT